MSFHIQLQKLYREIHACHICQNMDPSKALRRQEAIDTSMDVFIVSQALAEGQFRKSGVHFLGIHVRRDSWVSVMYAEELNSGKSSVTLQRTDRHGSMGQKSADFQLSL